MELLIIGYSNLFKNRILPLIDDLEFITSVSIAKYKEQLWDDAYLVLKKPVTVYNDYEIALGTFKGSLSYISTTNHSHFEWAKKSLEKGLHTIVDKPATLCHDETLVLMSIAQKKKLLISESTVYLYHPQIKLINNYINENSFYTQNLNFLFSFPPLNKENFRYFKDLGGGALLDTLPYLASICRFLYNEIPIESHLIINNATDCEVETSYSINLKFSNNRTAIGYSGFNTEYINRINILGVDFCLDIDRIFTLPDDVRNIIRIKSKNQYLELIAPEGNMFKEYFKVIYQSVIGNDFETLYNNMLMDSMTRDLIIKNNKYAN